MFLQLFSTFHFHSQLWILIFVLLNWSLSIKSNNLVTEIPENYFKKVKLKLFILFWQHHWSSRKLWRQNPAQNNLCVCLCLQMYTQECVLCWGLNSGPYYLPCSRQVSTLPLSHISDPRQVFGPCLGVHRTLSPSSVLRNYFWKAGSGTYVVFNIKPTGNNILMT